VIDKKDIKKNLAILFEASGTYELLRRMNRHKLLVIYYHRVVGNSEVVDKNLSGMFVREDAFEEQLRLLKRDYVPITEMQLADYQRGGASLPDYSVLITFDDGYKDNFTRAYPLLKKYDIPWTIFVATGYINKELLPWFDILFMLWHSLPELVIEGRRIGTNNHSGDAEAEYKAIFNKISQLGASEKKIFVEKLLAENLREPQLFENLFCSWSDFNVMGNDVTVGAHTRSHPKLSGLSGKEIEQEIIPARKELETRVGQGNITTFAYPYGGRHDFNDETIAFLKNRGFQHAFSTCYGLNDLSLKGDGQQFFTMNRIGIDYFDNVDCFKMKISGAWKIFDAINA